MRCKISVQLRLHVINNCPDQGLGLYLNQFRNGRRKTHHTSVDYFSLGGQGPMRSSPGACGYIKYLKWYILGEETV